MIVAFFLALIGCALILEAFFSGAETAYISVNFLKLMNLIEKKHKGALKVHDIIKKPDRLLTTTLVGTNLAVVISSACAAALFARVSPKYGALLTTLVMTPISFIFCQLLTKTVARYRANRIALWVADPLMLSERVFKPLVDFFTFIANSIARMVNPVGVRRNPFLTKDEIKSLIKDIAREGILEPQEKEAIDKIFDMTLTRAADIMVPLKQVARLDVSESREAVLLKVRAHDFSRFPVFDGKELKGMLHIFDFLIEETKPWPGLIRPVPQVDREECLDKVFSKMQPKHEHLAAVVKGTEIVGILSMEDLMEHVTLRLEGV
jgi:putative hemolysin